MSRFTFNLRIDSELKEDSQKLAAMLGISLAALITACLKQLVREKRVYLDFDKDKLSEYFLAAMGQARHQVRTAEFNALKRECRKFIRQEDGPFPT